MNEELKSLLALSLKVEGEFRALKGENLILSDI